MMVVVGVGWLCERDGGGDVADQSRTQMGGQERGCCIVAIRTGMPSSANAGIITFLCMAGLMLETCDL